jgi:hypothetical protein
MVSLFRLHEDKNSYSVSIQRILMQCAQSKDAGPIGHFSFLLRMRVNAKRFLPDSQAVWLCLLYS